ncbi:MAG: class I SAM-dependent methyltransferase [Smithellaceae bacterium]|nr:class I SAM-dependent methyltransferase [Smithellaceae bacterium]HOC61177.1 class I SAM-dependent methyltransferase [Smithellaceae bacterium]
MDSNNDRGQNKDNKRTDHSSTTEYYNRNALAYYQQTVNLDISNRYHQFFKLIPQNGKILDAGCGSGRDSLYFKQQGYSVVSFDISKELVGLASGLIGQKVLHMSFGDLDFENEFHGIWASASLLHIPPEEMDDALEKLSRALKKNGVLYASFKYGNMERTDGGRFFNDYNEEKLNLLMNRNKNLKIEKYWITEDVREDRKNELWMNVLFVMC